MNREHIGEHIVENERLRASDVVTGQQADHTAAVLEPSQVGAQALESGAVAWQVADLMKLDQGGKRTDSVVQRVMEALEGLIHQLQPFFNPLAGGGGGGG